MTPIDLTDVTKYVETHIGGFHQKRIASLDGLSLIKVLKRKNPYLFKAKYLLTSEEIVRGLVDAHISSNEETVFGDWLEGLAIFINEKVYGGRKSGINGIDLEFDKEGKRFIVNIKSGPNWGNASQIAKMKSDFKTAAKTLRTGNSGLQVVAVNGCCYGRNNSPDQGDYFKYCGQDFWDFISGDTNLYTELIEPLGYRAKEKNDEFQESYAKMINKFTLQFSLEYCDDNGAINWKKLVQFNSSTSSH
ncbi:MAG: cytosolic protein [Chlorobium sp.]|jgi:hypothetical protein|nr:cytosolic protein [Chlorobium sp.]